jgi:hypothetical protein
MTQATVGDIKLIEREPETNIFDRFLFRNTNFDGFDFSLHRGYLAKNNWKIHRIDTDPSLFSYGKFESETSLSDLETTYLKAKTGAGDEGDNKATSEFFLRELRYRRKQYAEIALDPWEYGVKNSLRSGGRWVANRFFDSTCGYGERPSKVIVSSAVIVGLFGILYFLMDVELPNEGWAGPPIYSLQSYVSLVIGAPESPNAMINLLSATESFIGAFFIALFVFALTRSLHR